MTIRTGILHIPMLEPVASEAIRQLLSDSVAQLLILEESAAADQRYVIEERLRTWADEREFDLILTVGATLPAPGPSAKEMAPLAAASVIERGLPGIAEAMRSYAKEQSELAMIDCSIAGIRGCTLIINLPARAAPAHLFLEAIVDLIPPLTAHLKRDETAQCLADVLTLETLDDEVAQANEEGGDSTASKERHGAVKLQEPEHKLDPAEFRAFLERRKSDSS